MCIPQQSLAEHTRVRVIVQTGSCKADLWGVIRRQDQDGLGIQFTNGTTVEDWKSLEAIIEQLEARRAVITAAKHTPPRLRIDTRTDRIRLTGPAANIIMFSVTYKIRLRLVPNLVSISPAEATCGPRQHSPASQSPRSLA